MSKEPSYNKDHAVFSVGARKIAEKRFPNGTVDWFEPIDFTIDYESVKLLELVAKGSYGTVYKSLFEGNIVASKLEDFHENDEEQVNLLVELTMLQSYPHDRLVKFIGAGCLSKSSAIHTERKLMIVMEYCERGALRECLREDLPWNIKSRIALDIADGIAFLHGHLVIHRDIKSTNVLIDKDWRAKLCDFSFACHNESTSKLEVTYGTDEFMSPEMACALDFDMSADIFSYGIVLCELISNREPSSDFLCRRPQDFFAVDEKEVKHATLSGCPESLIELTLMCCDVEPSKRPIAYTCVEKMTEILNELGGPDFEFNPPAPVEVNAPSPFREGKVRTSMGGGPHPVSTYSSLYDLSLTSGIGDFPQPYALMNQYQQQPAVRFSPGKYQSSRFLKDETVIAEKMADMERQILELKAENLRLHNTIQSILNPSANAASMSSFTPPKSHSQSQLRFTPGSNDEAMHIRLIELENRVGQISRVHTGDRSPLLNHLHADFRDVPSKDASVPKDAKLLSTELTNNRIDLKSHEGVKRELEQVYKLKNRVDRITKLLEQKIAEDISVGESELKEASSRSQQKEQSALSSGSSKRSVSNLRKSSSSSKSATAALSSSIPKVRESSEPNTIRPQLNSSRAGSAASKKVSSRHSLNSASSPSANSFSIGGASSSTAAPTSATSKQTKKAQPVANSAVATTDLNKALNHFLSTVQNASITLSSEETQEVLQAIQRTLQNPSVPTLSNHTLSTYTSFNGVSTSAGSGSRSTRHGNHRPPSGRMSTSSELTADFHTPTRLSHQPDPTSFLNFPQTLTNDSNHRESMTTVGGRTPMSAKDTWREVIDNAHPTVNNQFDEIIAATPVLSSASGNHIKLRLSETREKVSNEALLQMLEGAMDGHSNDKVKSPSRLSFGVDKGRKSEANKMSKNATESSTSNSNVLDTTS